MTPNEAANKFEQLKKLFEEDIPKLIQINGFTLATMVEERINQKGVNAFGRSFPPYESKAYQKWKEKKGKDVGFRNFSLTGDMLENFKIFKQGNDYVMGFDNTEMEERAAYNSDYADVKNIIQPSQKELDILYKDFNNGLDKLIKQIFA